MILVLGGGVTGLAAARDPKFIRTMQLTGMKMHPGAIRYWKERGFKLD